MIIAAASATITPTNWPVGIRLWILGFWLKGGKMGDMTVREAGKLGGQKRKEEMGADGYSTLGKMGGTACKERHGHDYYAEIGKKGGETVRRERGAEFFSRIGKKGGQRVKELIARGRKDEAANG